MHFKNQAILLVVAIVLAACNDGGGGSTQVTVAHTGVADGFNLSVFVNAPSATSRPDSIIQFGKTVYIAYQNAGEVKDGSDPTIMNAVVQYDFGGNAQKTYTIPGHVDGLLARKDTNALWALANEDGNPKLTTIDLASGNQKTYTATVNPPAHGGGFDDMQLINGVVYVSASNPANPGTAPPTVVSLTLNPNGTTFDVAPVLAGNAQAMDITPSVGGATNPTYGQMVPLMLNDPDSLETDPSGSLVLDSQADGKLVFISNLGPAQSVSVLSLTLYNDKDGPTLPVDDTRFVPAPGSNGNTFMLFTDAHSTTYRVDAPFKRGDAYSAGQGQVTQLDKTSGHLTPVVAGLGDGSALQDPHGIAFVVP